MHIIIMPPHIVIIGMPICIMLIMFSQHFMNMSFMAGSIGDISQVMPFDVIVHFIWQPIIMGIDIIGIPGIMPDIIGFIMLLIIMGIGIICIAGFISSSCSAGKKKAAPFEREDKSRCFQGQSWNDSPGRFPPARRPYGNQPRRILTI
jgi:hypothetical protein